MTDIAINDVSPRIQYTANGTTTAFTYPFPIFEASDLLVYLDGTPQTSGYAVGGAGETAGGSATFDAAPASGTVVTLSRSVPVERTTDFAEGGAFRAAVINEELDRIVCMVQQVDEENGRALARPVTSTATASLALPDPAAGKALKWNAAGDALTNSAYDPDAAQAACAASLTAAEAAQVACETALANVLAAYDQFDDRYLGAKISDPTTDNDGDPLVAGALYFNSVSSAMMLHTGTAWVAAYVSGDSILTIANLLALLATFSDANKATARTALGAAAAADVTTLDSRVTTLEAAIGNARGLGVNQTWRDMQASRSIGTAYANDTEAPICVSVSIRIPAAAGVGLSLDVGGVVVATSIIYAASANFYHVCVQGIVPAGASYTVTNPGGAYTMMSWAELR